MGTQAVYLKRFMAEKLDLILQWGGVIVVIFFT